MTPRPVRLQFNQQGAWRNALDFDASSDTVAAQVMHHAAMLCKCTDARARIITTDGMQTALTRWSAGAGWVNAATGEPL